MHILFLGPSCPRIESYFFENGHTFVRTEKVLSLAWVREQRFAFGLSYRYQKIIRYDIIDYFAGKLINMHTSFLPWNRGSYPNLWSYIENTPKGVTIHRIDSGIDTGDILLQQEIFIDLEKDTLRTSYDKLSYAIEQLFIDNAENILQNKISAVKQNECGSYHNVNDTLPYLCLMNECNLDIPLIEILKEVHHAMPYYSRNRDQS